MLRGSVSGVVVLAAVAVNAICIRSVGACSICQSGDPLAPAGTAKLDSGQVELALQYEFLTARARSDDDPTFIEHLTQMTLRPVFAFSPWDWLSTVVQIPVVYKNFSEVTEGFSPTEVRPTGLGDVDLGVRLFLLNRKDFDRFSWHRLGFSLGTSLPTGANEAQANGFRIDDHAQLGIGALAPYAGVLYAFSEDPWNFFGSISGKLPLTNSYSYQYGSALLWSIAGEYRIIDRLAFGLALDGRYAAHDTHDGRRQQNTGGLVLAATPIVKFNLYDELWLIGRVQLPFVTHLFGEQSLGPTVTAGVQYTFQ